MRQALIPSTQPYGMVKLDILFLICRCASIVIHTPRISHTGRHQVSHGRMRGRLVCPWLWARVAEKKRIVVHGLLYPVKAVFSWYSVSLPSCVWAEKVEVLRIFFYMNKTCMPTCTWRALPGKKKRKKASALSTAHHLLQWLHARAIYACRSVICSYGLLIIY
jgi:hypothetical protein